MLINDYINLIVSVFSDEKHRRAVVMFLNLIPVYLWFRVKQVFCHWPGFLWAKCPKCRGEIWVIVDEAHNQFEPCSVCGLTGRVFLKKEMALLNHFEKERV